MTEVDATLLDDLLALVSPSERGDPMSPLRWTVKSLRRIAAELRALGHSYVSRTSGRADVKAEAVSLLGWSNGGSTVLYTAEEARRTTSERPDFAKAVAFYPGCRLPAKREADDWTPALPCRELAERAQASGEPVSIVTYPGAYHDFDHPNLAVHLIDGLAYTADGRGSAHTGTDPGARANAIGRVLAFLAP